MALTYYSWQGAVNASAIFSPYHDPIAKALHFDVAEEALAPGETAPSAGPRRPARAPPACQGRLCRRARCPWAGAARRAEPRAGIDSSAPARLTRQPPGLRQDPVARAMRARGAARLARERRDWTPCFPARGASPQVWPQHPPASRAAAAARGGIACAAARHLPRASAPPPPLPAARRGPAPSCPQSPAPWGASLASSSCASSHPTSSGS